jgi:hypothetical protein
MDNRKPWRQLVLALVGMGAFCLFARSWKEGVHLVYDLPASLAVFGFIGQLLLEGLDWVSRRTAGQELGRPSGPGAAAATGPSRGSALHAAARFWVARVILVVAMTVVTTGRQFFGWDISGHLSCVLAVALTQTADRRLAAWERGLYWLPLPLVLWIRWTVFDRAGHGETFHALVFGTMAALPVMWLGWRSGRCAKPRKGMEAKNDE